MRSIWAAAFLLRRLRAERGVAVLIVVLVGITSFLVAAGPRLYNQVADDALRTAVRDASAAIRNIELTQDFTMPQEEDAQGVVDRNATAYQSLIGDSLEGLITSHEVVVTTPRFQLEGSTRFPTYLSLRYQTGLDDSAARLVEGRWPVGRGQRLPQAEFEFDGGNGPDPGTVETPTFEVAVSTLTAEETGLTLGTTYDGTVDSRDRLVPFDLVAPLRAKFEVVGIVEVDPTAPIWYSDNRVQRPGADFNADTPQVFATALVAPEAYPDLAPSRLRFGYAWHYFIDPTRLDAGTMPAVLEDLRRLRSTFSTSSLGGGGNNEDNVVARTGLQPVLETYLGQRAASEAVLSVAAIGPLAVAAGATAMLAVLLVARRRTTLALARGRGASARLILGAQLWEALLLVGGATAAGLMAALTFVPGRPSELSAPLALANGLLATLLLVAATWPVVRRPLQSSARDARAPIRLAPRRLVIELTVVGLALAGIFLVRQRGLTFEGGPAVGPELVKFDPFLAAVPVLAGLAAGIVATRLFPIPIRALGWLATQRRDLVPVLALRSVGRRPSFATLPLLILMLTAAFGSFALVETSSIDRGQVDASWRAVGADYRVEAAPGGAVDPEQVRAVPGITGVAAGYSQPAAGLQQGLIRARIQFLALDHAAYTAVAATGPFPPTWPSAFDEAAPAEGSTEASALGTTAHPIPVIVSPTLPGGAAAPGPGGTMRITILNKIIEVVVVEVRDSVLGLAEGTPYLIAPIGLTFAVPDLELQPNTVYASGTEAGAAGLASVATQSPEPATVVSRHEWYAALKDSPLVAVVSNGFRIGLLAAIIYAALAIITGLTLTAPERNRDNAFLRPLGLSRGQTTRLTLLEHGLPVLMAVVPGMLTGVAIALILESSLGLESFIGSGSAFQVRLDWAGIAAVAGVLALVVLASIATSTWLAQRLSVVDALRAGEA